MSYTTKKTISFTVIHFTVAMLLSWVLTGSALLGSVVALVEIASNTVAFYLQDKAWMKSSFTFTRIGLFLKTICFGILHLLIAFSVAWLLTGNLVVASLMALLEPLINTMVFYIHENIWMTKLKRSQVITY